MTKYVAAIIPVPHKDRALSVGELTSFTNCVKNAHGKEIKVKENMICFLEISDNDTNKAIKRIIEPINNIPKGIGISVILSEHMWFKGSGEGRPESMN